MKILKLWLTLIFILNSIVLFAQSDCPDAIIVCGNTNFSNLEAEGIGQEQEIFNTNACWSEEHNTLWLKLLIKDGGTFGFILTPEETSMVTDFDFWVYGPNVACEDKGTAIRCSTTNPLNAGIDYITTGMNEAETDVAEGPGSDGNAFIHWMDVNDDDTYYLIIDRPHGNGNFSIEWTGTATFHEIPVFYNPDNIPLDMGMTQCDDDGVDDGSDTFDLTIYETMFIGSQTDVAITYHTSINDMVIGADPIATPAAFANTTNPQTIYLRMTNPVTGCFDNLTFNITIDPGLTIGTPTDLKMCDTDGNGLRVFNLAQNDAAITLGAPDVAVTYFATQQDAVDNVNPLNPMHQNTVPYVGETIWARLHYINGCFGYLITSFGISIPPTTPVINNPGNVPLDITQCDDDGVDDASDTFNLTVYEAMFTGSQTDMVITYHTNANDMATGNNPIVSPEAFNNTVNPQPIYVRMYSAATGCTDNVVFNLTVDPGLTIGTPANLNLCDTDGTGQRVFDLSQNDAAITLGEPNVAVTYFATQQDAINNVSPLNPLHNNTTPYASEVIWARLYYVNGCFGYQTTSFSINVISQIPVLNNPTGIPLNITQCDDDGVDDASNAFNLTVYEAMFTGSQSNMAITYHTNSSDVATGANAIAVPAAFNNTLNPQTIYVRMASTVTGCYDDVAFTLTIDPGLTIGTPANLALCDTNSNGLQVFNLTLNNAAITMGVPNTAVSYFATQQDAVNNVNALSPQHQNSAAYGTDTLWARLYYTSGCFGYKITSFTISVLPLPVFNNPDAQPLDISQCDDDGVDDDSDAFNLTVYEAMFTGTQTNVAITYHTSSDDMMAGINPIATPAVFNNTANPQVMYVRMTNTITGCFDINVFTIDIDPGLAIGQPANLDLCDVDENGFRVFDLTQNDAAIIMGAPETAVTYFATQQDAENNVNPLNPQYKNTLPYLMQTIWARLYYINGCFGYKVTSFAINVLPLPEIVYDIDVVDFKAHDNSISIVMDNDDAKNYEFSLDGEYYSDQRFYNNLVPGIYTVYIRSLDLCKTISEEVAVLNYPRFFTPNQDGSHELWNVFYLSFFADARVDIFDRYGKLIKSYWGKEPGWDGTYNGENLPSTDYWFKLQFHSGRIIRGHFSLVR